LINFAKNVSGFDVIFGDHTNVEWSGAVNGQTVVECRSRGKSYSRTRLLIEQDAENSKSVIHVSVMFARPSFRTHSNATIAALVQRYKHALRPKLSKVLSLSPVQLLATRKLRFAESRIGNAVTDCFRKAYAGVMFAFINSGALRSNMTCSPGRADGGGAFCPLNFAAAGPFPITQGTLNMVSCDC
jgi:5'-nucleotidase